MDKTFISLFGGIGGFDLALERNGWKGVWYNDNDKFTVQTYNKNFKTNYKPVDITKVSTIDIPGHTLLCAGFPCQSFSIAGKRKGFNDTQGTMFFEICRIIKDKRPQFLLLENVRGLLSHDEGRTFTVILESLDELGYDATWQCLNSKHFGVPQNRERVFIIGHLRERGRKKVFFIRTTSEESNKRNTIKQIASSLQCPGHSGGNYKGMNMVQEIMISDIETVWRPKYDEGEGYEMSKRIYGTRGVSPTLQALGSDDIKITSHSPRSGNPKQGGTGILESSEHCFTIDSSPHYVNGIRKLTPIECERLQGFPDNWTEGVSNTQRYKQCGNSVTVNVIEEIIKEMFV